MSVGDDVEERRLQPFHRGVVTAQHREGDERERRRQQACAVAVAVVVDDDGEQGGEVEDEQIDQEPQSPPRGRRQQLPGARRRSVDFSGDVEGVFRGRPPHGWFFDGPRFPPL